MKKAYIVPCCHFPFYRKYSDMMGCILRLHYRTFSFTPSLHPKKKVLGGLQRLEYDFGGFYAFFYVSVALLVCMSIADYYGLPLKVL